MPPHLQFLIPAPSTLPVNLDVSVYVDGFHGDCSSTFTVGTVDEAGLDLIDATLTSLHRAIDVCGPGQPLYLIGRAIEEVAQERGYGVVSNFCGHGIGRNFHMLPYILHNNNRSPGEMKPGMVFTIEPMLVEGDPDDQVLWEDGWTVATNHGGRSAQFEHTMIITDDGVDILT